MTRRGADPARVRVLLSIQRALLDMITPDLRGVAVSWNSHEIRARFIYDAIVEDTRELVGEIETLVLADFPDDVMTRFHVELTPAPGERVLGDNEVWVYLRREP